MKITILLILGIWLGMVLGISFLEAPLKFRAPNITLPLGLGIGKLVFGALNKVEVLFAAILLLGLWRLWGGLTTPTIICFISILIIVILQYLWLSPVLHQRADAIISGLEVASTNHHFFYVGFEVIKVVLLIFGFIKIYHHA